MIMSKPLLYEIMEKSDSYWACLMLVPEGIERHGASDVEAALKLCEDSEWAGMFINGAWQFGLCGADDGTGVLDDFESKWNWLVLQAFYGGGDFIDVINRYIGRMTNGARGVDWLSIERADDAAMAFIDYHSVDAKGAFHAIEGIGISEWLANPECRIIVEKHLKEKENED